MNLHERQMRLRAICKEAAALKDEMTSLNLFKSAALMDQAIDRLGWEVADEMETQDARRVRYLLNTPDWIDADLFCGDGMVVALLVCDVKKAREMLKERGAWSAGGGLMMELRDGTRVLPVKAEFTHIDRPLASPVTGHRFGKIVSLLPEAALDPDVVNAVRSRTLPKRLMEAA